MNWFDLAIIGVIFIFLIVGLIRGLIKEVLSLVSWILSFWLAFTFAESTSAYFEPYLDSPLLRVIAAFAVLFVLSMLFLSAIGYLLHKILAVSGIRGIDRILGGLFGAAKGLVIIAALMLFAQETVLPEEDWWQKSMLTPHFQPLVEVIRSALPADIMGGPEESSEPETPQIPSQTTG